MRPPAVTRTGAWLEDLAADPAGVLAAQHSSDMIGGKVIRTSRVGNLRF